MMLYDWRDFGSFHGFSLIFDRLNITFTGFVLQSAIETEVKGIVEPCRPHSLGACSNFHWFPQVQKSRISHIFTYFHVFFILYSTLYGTLSPFGGLPSFQIFPGGSNPNLRWRVRRSSEKPTSVPVASMISGQGLWASTSWSITASWAATGLAALGGLGGV